MKTVDIVNVPWVARVGMSDYILPSELCDISSKSIQTVVNSILKGVTNVHDAAKIIYHFVKDNIPFEIPPVPVMKASQVLKMGGGDCTTKSILLAAMMRLARIPTRFWVSEIQTSLYNGLLVWPYDKFLPKTQQHVIAEICLDKWRKLEGITLDNSYLNKLLSIIPPDNTCHSHGIADPRPMQILVKELKTWDGVSATFCQQLAIVTEKGNHIDIESFFEMNKKFKLRDYLYQKYTVTQINRSIERVRLAV
jgi:hypothetical protein